MANSLNEHEAAELQDYILHALRQRQLGALAEQLETAASSRIVAEVDSRQFDDLPRRVRDELGTQSVRPKSRLEQLATLVEILDAMLRQGPSVAAATAATLDAPIAKIRFAFDETAIDAVGPRSESDFALTELSWPENEGATAMAALATLWGATGRETELRRNEQGVWLL
jgi:hypothetical protein